MKVLNIFCLWSICNLLDVWWSDSYCFFSRCKIHFQLYLSFTRITWYTPTKKVLEKFSPHIRKCGSNITTWPGASEGKISGTKKQRIINVIKYIDNSLKMDKIYKINL